MRKGWIVIGLVLLVLISAGCTSLLEPSYKIRCSTGEKVSDPSLCPEVTTATTTPSTTTTTPATTIPALTTSAPEVTETSTTTPTPITTAPTTTAPTTQPPETVRTTNPQHYALTLADVGSDYLVGESKYDNFEAMLDEGMMGEEDRNHMKDWGFIESYYVSYGTETEGITNMVSRHGSREGARKRLDYLRDMHSNREDFSEMISVESVPGREFGDNSFYVIQILKFMGSGTDVYPKMISLDFIKDNYHANIVINDMAGEVTISDLYPYAEILENRITNDEHIVPTPTAILG